MTTNKIVVRLAHAVPPGSCLDVPERTAQPCMLSCLGHAILNMSYKVQWECNLNLSYIVQYYVYAWYQSMARAGDYSQ